MRSWGAVGRVRRHPGRAGRPRRRRAGGGAPASPGYPIATWVDSSRSLSTKVARHAVAPTELTHPESPADGLAAVVALRRLADRMEDAEVERALRDGWTWAQVAEALGVTRQAVHKKHARRLRDVRAIRRVTRAASRCRPQRRGRPRVLERRGRAPARLARGRRQHPAGARPARGRARPAGAPRRRSSATSSACSRTVGIDAERRRRLRQLPPHQAALGRVGQAGPRARARRRPSAAATARSAASTSCSACCAPSTARCRGSSRPRGSTATS